MHFKKLTKMTITCLRAASLYLLNEDPADLKEITYIYKWFIFSFFTFFIFIF